MTFRDVSDRRRLHRAMSLGVASRLGDALKGFVTKDVLVSVSDAHFDWSRPLDEEMHRSRLAVYTEVLARSHEERSHEEQ